MTVIIEASIITSIILIILSQRLDVRIYGKRPLKISIGFTLFAIELSLNRKKRKKARRVPIKKKISRGLFALSVAKELLKRTHVTVRSTGTLPPDNAEDMPRLTLAAISLPAILAYIRSSAAGYERIVNAEVGEPDVLFSFSCFGVFISLFKASYYKIKYNLEKRKRNAGQQNQ